MRLVFMGAAVSCCYFYCYFFYCHFYCRFYYSGFFYVLIFVVLILSSSNVLLRISGLVADISRSYLLLMSQPLASAFCYAVEAQEDGRVAPSR